MFCIFPPNIVIVMSSWVLRSLTLCVNWVWCMCSQVKVTMANRTDSTCSDGLRIWLGMWEKFILAGGTPKWARCEPCSARAPGSVAERIGQPPRARHGPGDSPEIWSIRGSEEPVCGLRVRHHHADGAIDGGGGDGAGQLHDSGL